MRHTHRASGRGINPVLTAATRTSGGTIVIHPSRARSAALLIGQASDDADVNALEAMRHDIDRDLERRIACFLYGRNLPALRRLETEVCNGVAIVEGRVRSYYEKQLATFCCQRVAGVLRVVNRVRVLKPDDDSPAA